MTNVHPPEIRCLRVRDLSEAEREGWRIEVRCRAKECGRSRIVEAGPLIRLASIKRWDTDFISLGNKLRCGACKAKFPEVRGSSLPADGGKPIGPATEGEFLRMVRERR